MARAKPTRLIAERPRLLKSETQASAIARNWILNATLDFEELHKGGVTHKSGRKKMLEHLRRMITNMGDLCLHCVEDKPAVSRGIPRKVSYVSYKSRERMGLTRDIRVVPLVHTGIDTKSMQIYDRSILMALSDHAMGQMLMRSKASNLAEFNAILKPVVSALIFHMQEETIPLGDLVILSRHGYMPLTPDEPIPDEGVVLVAKTFVGASDYNNMKARILAFADVLEPDEGLLMSEQVWEQLLDGQFSSVSEDVGIDEDVVTVEAPAAPLSAETSEG